VFQVHTGAFSLCCCAENYPKRKNGAIFAIWYTKKR
jgi:hypothetical protein